MITGEWVFFGVTLVVCVGLLCTKCPRCGRRLYTKECKR